MIESIDNEAVVADFVWIPKLQNDSRAAAESVMPESPDPRARSWWDEDMQLSDHLTEHIDCTDQVWDIYTIYEPGSTWDGDGPGPPDFWLHKLTTCPSDQFMDRYEFWQAVEDRIPNCSEVVLE